MDLNPGDKIVIDESIATREQYGPIGCRKASNKEIVFTVPDDYPRVESGAINVDVPNDSPCNCGYCSSGNVSWTACMSDVYLVNRKDSVSYVEDIHKIFEE